MPLLQGTMHMLFDHDIIDTKRIVYRPVANMRWVTLEARVLNKPLFRASTLIKLRNASRMWRFPPGLSVLGIRYG
jgi:hypothetical protein